MAGLDHQALMEAAATLFARRQADVAEASEIERWLDADPAHAAAFARVEAAWERADRLKALSGPQGQAGDVAAWRPSRRWAAGAALALIGGGAGAGWFAATHAVEKTRLGERRMVSLEDGSRIELNTDSRVKVAYTEGERRIVLTRGEALFDVAKDASRPFIVSVNGAEVRAVGTAFNIRLRADVVELTVTEGVVAVDGRPTAPVEQPVRRVAQGAGVVIATGAVAEVELEPEVLRRRLAWREGVIELEGETLEQAAAEFNRYNPRKLVVADAQVAAIRVGGRFGVSEVDRFLTALQAGFPVRAVPGDAGAIYLVQAS